MAKSFSTIDEAREYIQQQPLNTIIEIAAQSLVNNSIEKIIITEEQLRAFFRVRGFRVDGSRETRGRFADKNIFSEE